jgi:hypothetical protein
MFRFLAVSLASGLAMTAVAHAQAAEDDGLDCVYNELVDRAVEAAKATCATRHNYTQGQRDAAGELGVLASVLDYLSEELMFSGVGDDAVDGVLTAYDSFTEEDVDALFNPDWRSDAVFLGEMKAKMLSAGIPDEADLMDIALMILEITAMVEEVSYMFMAE